MFTFLIQWTLFIILNLLAGLTAFLWAKQCHSSKSGIAGFSSNWITLFLAQIVFVQTMLGVLDRLNIWNVLIVLVCIFVLSLLILWKRFHLSVLELSEEIRSSTSLMKRKPHIMGIIIFVVWVGLSLFITALAEPSTLPDTLSYHLPMPASWLQSSSLKVSYIPRADVPNSYFPGNGELLYLWMLAPFHNDLLIRLVNLFMWLILGVGLFSLSRRFGASGEASFAASLLFLFTPTVLAQTTETSLDMANAAVFMLALGHLMDFGSVKEAPHRLEAVVLFALSCGLFLGIKYSAPVYLLLLLGVFLAYGGWQLQKLKSSILSILNYIGLVSLGTILLGGFWYIRNWILTGSPMYPLSLSLSKFLNSSNELEHFSYRFNQLWWQLGTIPLSDLVQGTLQALGFLYPVMSIISVVVLIKYFIEKRFDHSDDLDHNHPDMRQLFALIALIGGSFIVYLHTPYSVMRYSPDEPINSFILAVGMRLGMIPLALFAVIIALGTSLTFNLSRIFWLILGLFMLQSLFASFDRSLLWGRPISSNHSLAAGIILATSLYVIGRFWKSLSLFIHWSPAFISVGILICLLMGGILYQVKEYREQYRFHVYRRVYGDVALAWQWVSQNFDQANIAFTGFNQSYPLFGLHLQNYVRYVNIRGELDDRFHNLEYRAYREGGDYYTWLRNLKEWHAEYLVSGNTTVEHQWASQHPDLFKQIFADNQLYIYQISWDVAAETESIRNP